MIQRVNDNDLDFIIDEMIGVVEKSKDEIFNISEGARTDHEHIKQELKQTKDEVFQLIDEGHALEQKVRHSRKRLSEVSRHFDHYSEQEIREVYEKTHAMQTTLAMKQQKEKVLREKRDDLERRLITLDQTIERAEGLAGKISVILTYLNDDFKQVNQIVEEAKEKQEFGLKIIEAQEEERRRISREIHDGPAQMLANILLRSELVDRTFREGGVEESLLEIQNVRKMIRSSLFEVRRIIYDLRPMALDDLGLIPTLRKYAATVSDYNDIDIDFTSIGTQDRLSQKYEIAFFRLVQESIQNAIKHAEASCIKVKIEISNRLLTTVVKDNGKGFDPSLKNENSFGLIGMKERVEMLDGTMKIDSTIGKGTTIFVHVPLEQDING